MTLFAGQGHLGLSGAPGTLSCVGSEKRPLQALGCLRDGQCPHLLEMLRLPLARSTKPKATGFRGAGETNQLLTPLFQSSVEKDVYGDTETEVLVKLLNTTAEDWF